MMTKTQCDHSQMENYHKETQNYQSKTQHETQNHHKANKRDNKETQKIPLTDQKNHRFSATKMEKGLTKHQK